MHHLDSCSEAMSVERRRFAAFAIVGAAFLAAWSLSRGHGGRSAKEPASLTRWVVSVSLPLLISGYGLARRSLDASGAALAVVVGFVLTAASACFSASLIVFFISSSWLTKWRGKEKRRLEEDYREGQYFLALVRVWSGSGLSGLQPEDGK